MRTATAAAESSLVTVAAKAVTSRVAGLKLDSVGATAAAVVIVSLWTSETCTLTFVTYFNECEGDSSDDEDIDCDTDVDKMDAGAVADDFGDNGL